MIRGWMEGRDYFPEKEESKKEYNYLNFKHLEELVYVVTNMVRQTTFQKLYREFQGNKWVEGNKQQGVSLYNEMGKLSSYEEQRILSGRAKLWDTGLLSRVIQALDHNCTYAESANKLVDIRNVVCHNAQRSLPLNYYNTQINKLNNVVKALKFTVESFPNEENSTFKYDCRIVTEKLCSLAKERKQQGDDDGALQYFNDAVHIPYSFIDFKCSVLELMVNLDLEISQIDSSRCENSACHECLQVKNSWYAHQLQGNRKWKNKQYEEALNSYHSSYQSQPSNIMLLVTEKCSEFATKHDLKWLFEKASGLEWFELSDWLSFKLLMTTNTLPEDHGPIVSR